MQYNVNIHENKVDITLSNNLSLCILGKYSKNVYQEIVSKYMLPCKIISVEPSSIYVKYYLDEFKVYSTIISEDKYDVVGVVAREKSYIRAYAYLNPKIPITHTTLLNILMQVWAKCCRQVKADTSPPIIVPRTSYVVREFDAVLEVGGEAHRVKLKVYMPLKLKEILSEVFNQQLELETRIAALQLFEEEELKEIEI